MFRKSQVVQEVRCAEVENEEIGDYFFSFASLSYLIVAVNTCYLYDL